MEGLKHLLVAITVVISGFMPFGAHHSFSVVKPIISPTPSTASISASIIPKSSPEVKSVNVKYQPKATIPSPTDSTSPNPIPTSNISTQASTPLYTSIPTPAITNQEVPVVTPSPVQFNSPQQNDDYYQKVQNCYQEVAKQQAETLAPLQAQFNDINNQLNNLEDTINKQVAGTFTSEWQRQELLASEKGPLIQKLTETSNQMNSIRSQFDTSKCLYQY